MRSENSTGSLEREKIDAVWGLLVPACAANGIARTTAWKLAKLKILETISIGRRRYVRLSSFDNLAERLAAVEEGNL